MRPAALLAIPVVAAAVLRAMGRRWWCACGSLAPWSGEVMSRHNSQHLLDAYSFTHVSHGLGLWALTVPLRSRLSTTARVGVALAVEALWEVVENTDAVIDRYREATISLDYFGDSVLNSLGDLGCCALGLLLAARLPRWGSLALFVASELLLAAWIRDGLLLNVLMLIWPLDAVKAWQAG